MTSSKMGHIWNAAAVSMSCSHAPNGAHLPQIDTARSQILRYNTGSPIRPKNSSKCHSVNSTRQSTLLSNGTSISVSNPRAIKVVAPRLPQSVPIQHSGIVTLLICLQSKKPALSPNHSTQQTKVAQNCRKRLNLGCVNSLPEARGGQEA